MSDFNWQKVETIIDQVLDLPEDERQPFIEKQCKDDKKLKGEITQLLESIFNSEGWLEDPDDYKEDFYREISEDVELLSSTHSLVGREVGSYTIKSQIGEGGMGVVYVAERTDGEFEHQVAIKIIRQGRATEENIQRFRREQQILAGLNHPGIGRLYDGGVTDDGFPYIIMEFVDGIPVDEYCQKHDCTIDEKLDLFKKILEAVRYAHENLVIHRDLKPGNILVDKSGNIKILDFGISKLLEEEDEASLTQTGTRLLTPRYASPEQIRQGNITTSSDLYALGIVLFELLSGGFPFDFKNLSRYELEQAILNTDPPKPSKEAGNPHTSKELKGDLDAIILKAIRKKPTDRYRGITELLDDILNYRQNLPVNAQKGTTSYRINKFVKRHRKGIIVTAGVVVLLVGLTIFYTSRIARERDQAQLQAERAEEITDFLVSILKMNNPSENDGEDITVSDALLRGIDYVDEQQMSPFNRATILGTIGSIQINTGDIDEAGATLTKAMNLVTDSLKEQGTKTLAIGTEYAEWNETVGNIKKAEQVFSMTDSLFQVHHLTASTSFLAHLLNYSDFLMEIGQFKKALNVLSQSERHFRGTTDDNKTMLDYKADLYNDLGRAYKNMGQNKKALQNLDKALALKKKIYDENNPKIGKLYHNMGVVYANIGEYAKAMDMAQKAYKIRLKAFGPDHQLVGSTLHLLGNVALALGKYDQAFKYIRQSIAINKRKHGPNHFRYAFAIREYAKALAKTGRYEEALKQLDKATAIIVKNYGTDHAYYGYLAYTYVTIYGEAGNFAKAMEYGKKTVENFKKNFGPEHPNVGKAYFYQGKYALESNKIQLADSLLLSALKIFKLHFDSDNPFIHKTDSLLTQTKKTKLKKPITDRGLASQCIL